MKSAFGRFAAVLTLLTLAGSLVLAQTLPDGPRPQNDAARPASPVAAPPAAPAASTPPPSSSSSSTPAPPANPVEGPAAAGGAQPQVTPIPADQLPPDAPAGPREQLFSLTKEVSFVTVPVTVKDQNGHLVQGLTRADFSVLEDGERQNITFFTSDPFPLSVAVVIGTGTPVSEWNKIKDTLSALVGAFSQYDEVSVFTYGNTVSRVQDFSTVSSEKLVQTIRSLKARQGSGYGPPITSGSMAGYPTPSVNGRPLDPTLPSASNPVIPRESFVLNDAVLMAAQELGRRDMENRARGIPPTRKVLFIVSDGRELGSMNGYADVLKVLLTRQISVYAVAVESGIPGYGTAQRIRIPLPGFGVSNILPKYASATGGQYYSESSAHALEDAYTRVTEEARNQYTIGYRTRSTPSSTFRKVEVVVHRARLRVYARDGYYPLPPGR